MFELRLFLADCNIAPGGRTLLQARRSRRTAPR